MKTRQQIEDEEQMLYLAKWLEGKKSKPKLSPVKKAVTRAIIVAVACVAIKLYLFITGV